MNAITIWIADNYSKGCPKNSAGREIGLGSTREHAIANCQPWANQAAWFRNKARSVTVTDAFDETNRDHRLLAEELDRLGLGGDDRSPKLATLIRAALAGGAIL